MEFHADKEQNLWEQIPPGRLNTPWHFTASSVVIADESILLVHHKRIGAWLPPGGHIDEGELPHQTAIRETFEETGVSVEIVSEAMPLTGRADAFFLPQPLCIHGVKAFEKGADVHHLDIAFLCRPNGWQSHMPLPSVRFTDEVQNCKWFALSALDTIPLAKNVMEIVELALRRINSLRSVCP